MVALAAAGAGGPTAYAGEGDKPHVVFTIRSPQITESSSLARSTVHPGLIYTTNDSGDDGTVYTLDGSTGAIVGRTTLAGADPLDVEAISANDDGSLIVADIGDNDADHSTADLYRIDQPGPGDHAVTPQRVDLTYTDGPRDAESIIFDTTNGRAFVVSKELGRAHVYATSPHFFRHHDARLRPIADATTVATDATWLPGHRYVVVRTYVDATVYAYPSWKPVTTFVLPPQQQGESITTAPAGHAVWIGSEGERSRVLQVQLPALPGDGTSEPSPGGTASPPGGSTAASESNGHESAKRAARIVFMAAAAGLVLLVVGSVVTAARRRQPR